MSYRRSGRRYPSWRRLRSKFRHDRRVVIPTVACLVVFACLAAVTWATQRFLEWRGERSSFAQAIAIPNIADLAGPMAQPMPVAPARGVVYKYSVVPGGVKSSEELRSASRHDGIVGRHYAGFAYNRARVVELSEAKLAYLSYRLHDKIYWTRKKVALRKGEKIITDGKIGARTRCGNQVSESAQPAVSPEEPPASAFEEPVADGGSATQIPFPGSFESALLTRPGLNGFGPEGPATGLGGGLFGPIVAGGGSGIAPPPIPSPGPKPPNPPPPPTPVPEPGTIVLIGSGIATICLHYRKFAKKA